MLPGELARLVPWDPVASALNAAPLLQGNGREELVEQIRSEGAKYTWKDSADKTMAVYEQVVAARSLPSRSHALELARLEQRVALLEERARTSEQLHEDLLEAIGPDGLSLVGPQGVLSPDLRRPVLAVAARPWLRGPILGTLKIPYRIAYWLHHRVKR